METFQEDESQQREINMQEEYKHWASIKPKLVKTANGKFAVSGIKLKNT